MEDKVESLQRKIVVLGAVSSPFFIAFGLGSYATFKGNGEFFISALNDPAVSKIVLAVGLVGAVIAFGLKFALEQQVKKLSSANT